MPTYDIQWWLVRARLSNMEKEMKFIDNFRLALHGEEKHLHPVQANHEYTTRVLSDVLGY
ncbi:MAG: hypothetical protein KAW12_07275 [Candidatus Aminicenantes bacterium]|nr:hypothetical protein [Candidatus Aminicenantes bacterium]